MTHNREKAERLHVCAHVPHVFLTVCLSGMFDSPVEVWACLCGTTWELGKSSGVFVHWSHDRRLCQSKALNYGFWQQIPEMTLTQIKSNLPGLSSDGCEGVCVCVGGAAASGVLRAGPLAAVWLLWH